MPPPPLRRIIPTIPFLLLVASLVLGGLMYRNLSVLTGTHTMQKGSIASPPLVDYASYNTESIDTSATSNSNPFAFDSVRSSIAPPPVISSPFKPTTNTLISVFAAFILIVFFLFRYCRRSKQRDDQDMSPGAGCDAQAGGGPVIGTLPVSSNVASPPWASRDARFHVFTDYPGVQLPGLVIPQQVWINSNTQQLHQHPLPPIRFGLSGVPIVNLIQEVFTGIPDAAVIPQLGGGQRITLRIWWHGYEQWSRPVNTFSNAASHGGYYNKGRVGNLVANVIKKFLMDMSDIPSTDQRPDWWVSAIRLEELYLLELRNVSVGSWQPVLCLRRY